MENTKNAVSIEVLKKLFIEKFDNASYGVKLCEILLNVAINESNAKKSNILKAQKKLNEARLTFAITLNLLSSLELSLDIK
jgi:hypothetical protein